MDYKAKAEEIVQKMKGYREDENGWKLCKESVSLSFFSHIVFCQMSFILRLDTSIVHVASSAVSCSTHGRNDS